jgi:hypothetical protein
MEVTEATQKMPLTDLSREFRVLSSLAYFGWLDSQQLQALCFPDSTMSTVRTTLHYFEEAGWVHHVRWCIGPPDGGHIWATRSKGIQMIERSVSIVPHPVSDLARPTTAIEREEWRVQLAIRTLVTRLVLRARQQPLLASLALTLPPTTWQAALADPGLEPDAVLSIGPDGRRRQQSTWLPWVPSAPLAASSVAFAIYGDRSTPDEHLPSLVRSLACAQHATPYVIVVVLNSEARLAVAQNTVNEIHAARSAHVTTWQRAQDCISHCVRQ